MRCILLAFALTVTACAQEEPPPPQPAAALAPGTFVGGERDALCIGGSGQAQRAGVVVYGADNANCAVTGRIEQAGAGWALIPAGDAACRIPLTIQGDRVALGTAPAACAYYCGPGVSLAGKAFDRAATSGPVTDLAGDPLC